MATGGTAAGAATGGTSAGAATGGSNLGGGGGAGAGTSGTATGGSTTGGSATGGTTTGGSSGAAGSAAGGSGGSASTSGVRVIGYLPNYSGSYSSWAAKLDFTKMTHLNLAFALSNTQNGWDMGASDQEVAALVTKAHAAGVKVLASLGGGGGDQSVLKQYNNASNLEPLVNNLDAFLDKLALDGADIDIESPENLGGPYSAFVQKVVDKLHPKGKLVTAAVAQYLQDNMSDTTLKSFDFVNIMVYTTLKDSTDALNWYHDTKGVGITKLVIGAGFFGTSNPYKEWAYKDILATDANAWSKDVTSVQGNTVHYTGEATMKQIANLSKGWGGIMFWDWTEDAPAPHSLWQVIQSTM